MDMRFVALFVGLSFFAGTFLGTGFFLAFLDEQSFSFKWEMVATGVTLTTALIAAYMVKVQLQQNYYDQLKLEKLRYISTANNYNQLQKLFGFIAHIKDSATKLHESVFHQDTDGHQGQFSKGIIEHHQGVIDVAAKEAKDLSFILAPLSHDLFREVLTFTGNIEAEFDKNRCIKPDDYMQISDEAEKYRKKLQDIISHSPNKDILLAE